MPYQCNDNYDLFEESCSTNVIVLGDFNDAVKSTFENKLIACLIHIN